MVPDAKQLVRWGRTGARRPAEDGSRLRHPRPQKAPVSPRIRFFSPYGEVDVSGHVTVAVYAALAAAGGCGFELPSDACSSRRAPASCRRSAGAGQRQGRAPGDPRSQPADLRVLPPSIAPGSEHTRRLLGAGSRAIAARSCSGVSLAAAQLADMTASPPPCRHGAPGPPSRRRGVAASSPSPCQAPPRQRAHLRFLAKIGPTRTQSQARRSPRWSPTACAERSADLHGRGRPLPDRPGPLRSGFGPAGRAHVRGSRPRGRARSRRCRVRGRGVVRDARRVRGPRVSQEMVESPPCLRIAVDAAGRRATRRPTRSCVGARRRHSLAITDAERLILVGDTALELSRRCWPRSRHDAGRVRVRARQPRWWRCASSRPGRFRHAARTRRSSSAHAPGRSRQRPTAFGLRRQHRRRVRSRLRAPLPRLVAPASGASALAAVCRRPEDAARREDPGPFSASHLGVGATHRACAAELTWSCFALMECAACARRAHLASNPRPLAQLACCRTAPRPGKGPREIVDAHGCCSQHTDINFIGNVEGVDIPRGVADVIVCSASSATWCIKMLEGVSETVVRPGPLRLQGEAAVARGAGDALGRHQRLEGDHRLGAVRRRARCSASTRSSSRRTGARARSAVVNGRWQAAAAGGRGRLRSQSRLATMLPAAPRRVTWRRRRRRQDHGDAKRWPARAAGRRHRPPMRPPPTASSFAGTSTGRKPASSDVRRHHEAAPVEGRSRRPRRAGRARRLSSLARAGAPAAMRVTHRIYIVPGRPDPDALACSTAKKPALGRRRRYDRVHPQVQPAATC